jgi:hypothetical protein
MPAVSKLELNTGHGDRKTDTRGQGGSRGVPVENGLYAKIRCVAFLDQFHDTVFNPGHRHANRRGLPRGPKETEISASVPDAKNSKRGSASYGAHEVRLFFNFLFAGWSRLWVHTQTTHVQVLIEENLGLYLLIKKPLSSSYVGRVQFYFMSHR